MKFNLLVPVFAVVFLSSCRGSQSAYTDSEDPGFIKVVFLYDDNRNSRLDGGESALRAEQIAEISQELSCPPDNTRIVQDSNENGVIELNDLKHGKYCLSLSNGFIPTTRMNQEVYVSSG